MKRRASRELSRSDGTTSDEQATKGPDIIHFNAGGSHYETLLTTLRRSSMAFPDSVFAILFAGEEWQQGCDENGAYFVDRDGETFGSILRVLRNPHLINQIPNTMSSKVWQYELEFWGLVKPSLQRRIKQEEQKPLVELGREIRRRVQTNEQIAVQQLLSLTGYINQAQRHTRLLVPMGECLLYWGVDLGQYLISEQGNKATVRVLGDILTPCHVKIERFNGASIVYKFNETDYTTSRPEGTVQIMIELEEEDC